MACTAQNAKYESVDVASFEECVNTKDVIVLDVRTSEEYAEGHLNDAINIDVTKNDFAQVATASLPKDATVALYCRSGRRSKKAADILSAEGYKVTELDSGYLGWTKEQKPVTHEEVDFFVAAGGTKVWMYCIKHGSVKMRIGDKWLYVDPVTDKIPPVTDYTTMPKADYLLITHEHMDHLDAKAIEQLTKDGTILITNPRSSELLGGKGVVMKNGDEQALDGMSLKAVPAYNCSEGKQQFHPKGRDNGYVLSLEGLRIYIAGDTEDIEEMTELKDIDVAFMPCNLPFTMTPEQLAKAAKVVQPKVLFPYHYGQTDINQVVKLLQGENIDVRIRQYQ